MTSTRGLPADILDVLVVGGGAAGIATARRLASRRRSVLVVEAMTRLGGRASTVVAGGMPLDLGCGWLHSAERNPLTRIAEEAGIAINRSEQAWTRQLDLPHFTQHEWAQARRSYERLRARLVAEPPTSDRAADAVSPDDRWRPYLDAISGFVNGVELDKLSVRDFIIYDDAADDENWRLEQGLGLFIAGLGRALPVSLGTRVEAIEEGAVLKVVTNRGDITARSAIITTSTDVLASGTIRLSPRADDHLHAAAALPLGNAEKVYLAIDHVEALPPESHVHGRSGTSDTGTYYVRPFGRPVIECYFGGGLAAELARTNRLAAFAIEELTELLGAERVGVLTSLAASHWVTEQSIGGSYSHALPGHSDARVKLAAPISERLCIAGEACSVSDFSTVHGAWESGCAAADWIDGQFDRVTEGST